MHINRRNLQWKSGFRENELTEREIERKRQRDRQKDRNERKKGRWNKTVIDSVI